MNLADELHRLNEESKARKLEHDEYVYLISSGIDTKGLLKEAEEMNRCDSEKVKSLRAEVAELSVNCCIAETSLKGYKDKVLSQSIEINEKTKTLEMLQIEYGNDMEKFIIAASPVNSKQTKPPLVQPQSGSDSKDEKEIAYLEGKIDALQLYIRAAESGLQQLRALLNC